MDAEVNEPAIHENPCQGDNHPGNLEVQTVLGMRLAVCGALNEASPVPIGKATTNEGPSYETESCCLY